MRWEYMWGDRSDRLHEDDLAWPRPARCVLPSTLLSNQGQIPVCLHQYLTVHWETKDRHGWVGGRDGHAFSMRPYFMLRRVVDAKTMHRSKTSPALPPQNISCIPALKHLLNSRNKTSPAAKQLLHPRLSSPQQNKTSIAPDGRIPDAVSPPPHSRNCIKIKPRNLPCGQSRGDELKAAVSEWWCDGWLGLVADGAMKKSGPRILWHQHWSVCRRANVRWPQNIFLRSPDRWHGYGIYFWIWICWLLYVGICR